MNKKLSSLEALEKIKVNWDNVQVIGTKYFKIVEKSIKALEIINGKNVNIRAFKKVLLMEQNDNVKLRIYNSQNYRNEDDLTKEEFDLLKEVLK